MSLGELLRRKREDLGLTIEDVYRISRIRASLVQAMETERWEAFPSPAQARAFVRRYAKAIGISTEVLENYEDAFPVGETRFKAVTVKGPLKSQNRSYWVFFSVVAFLVAAIAISWRLGLFKVGEGASSPSGTPANNQFQDAVREKLHGLGGQESPLKKNLEKVPIPSTVPNTTLAQREGHLLVLNCIERSWVRIYLDDEPVKEYLFNPGDRYQWVAKEGLEVKIGNAEGVELEYNGKRLSGLGKKGQVVLLRFPESFKRRVSY